MLALACNTYRTVRDIMADSYPFPESEFCPKYRITAPVLRDGGKVRVARNAVWNGYTYDFRGMYQLIALSYVRLRS